MLACKRGKEDVVAVLVERGAEICLHDCKNHTATAVAVARKHTSCLTYLNTQVELLSSGQPCLGPVLVYFIYGSFWEWLIGFTALIVCLFFSFCLFVCL